MKTEMPLSKPIRRILVHTEEMLDTEVSLLRQPEAEPGGTLVDKYTYDIDSNVIIFPAQYVGLLKDFVIAKHCTHLLIKGAAAKKGDYKVCSYTADSVFSGMRQIYFDALKDEAKKENKLPVQKLLQMLFILFSHFNDDINEIPWNAIINADVYHRMTKIRKTQLYHIMKESKNDMDEMMEQESIVPRRYFVLNKAMFYARDMYLAKTLPADELMPVLNIPQMKKFNHLEVKEMLTTRWTHTAWYQSKVFGDNMLSIIEKPLGPVNWKEEPTLDYYYDLYKVGKLLTDNLIGYMTMRDWFVWEPPKHLLDAHDHKAEYEKDALKRIFGDLITDTLEGS
ncbi:hypothetical protein [Methanoregula sp.]|uniref:hypothetical protein n=1 Tax=Methanoregula sp. TaxID=2052170 RepID=UPI000CB8ECB4|nr:hypothetical protein [Methanoregula sp.]PKG31478.1 MAG: hypothetical protein CW742_13205 [Methanoregula sp.]